MRERRRILEGRYELIRQIGEGGFSRAYLAYDLRLGRNVVAKILRSELTSDPASRQRFEREARIAASVSGTNIVDIYDYGPVDGQPVIVSQWIEGVDLSKVVRKNRGLRAEDAIGIMLDVLAGLETLHRSGVQHRDIKPQNILLPKWDAPAKLTDFGISRAQSDPKLTEPGQVLGSPAYMSPEQIEGMELTAATDIYSASVVLFELMTGSVPFQGETASQIMLQHLASSPPPPRMLNPDIPAELERAILTGLSKPPEARFSTASEMADALRAVSSSTPSTRPQHQPDTQTRVIPVEERVTVVSSMPERRPDPPRPTVNPAPDQRSRKQGFRRERKRVPYRQPQPSEKSTPKRQSWFRRRIRRIPRYPMILMFLVVITILLLAVTQGTS